MPSISLMMIVPAIIGYFIDQHFQTLILFTTIGLVLGISCSIWQLIKFVALQDQDESNQSENSGGRPPQDL